MLRPVLLSTKRREHSLRSRSGRRSRSSRGSAPTTAPSIGSAPRPRLRPARSSACSGSPARDPVLVPRAPVNRRRSALRRRRARPSRTRPEPPAAQDPPRAPVRPPRRTAHWRPRRPPGPGARRLLQVRARRPIPGRRPLPRRARPRRRRRAGRPIPNRRPLPRRPRHRRRRRARRPSRPRPRAAGRAQDRRAMEVARHHGRAVAQSRLGRVQSPPPPLRAVPEARFPLSRASSRAAEGWDADPIGLAATVVMAPSPPAPRERDLRALCSDAVLSDSQESREGAPP